MSSKLEMHGMKELTMAGYMGKEGPYEGELGRAVMHMLRSFASRNASGEFSERVLELFNRLVKFELLSGVTADPEEWRDVTSWFDEPTWQNKRDRTIYSKDQGKTWYKA
jgi:hypothetical protein